MNKISEAICFATQVFDGQKRKCEYYPAILHSLEAGTICQTLTDDEDVVVSAILHDVVEDAGVTLDEVKEKFGERVACLVASETENKREELSPTATWQIRKQEAIDDLKATQDVGTKAIFLADKLSNMRSMYRCKLKFGDKLWLFFHQSDPKAHEWYYTSIAQALASEFSDTLAYQEYLSLIEKTF